MENLVGYAGIPLLPSGGKGVSGGRGSVAAVKAVCKTVARIEGPLRMADRNMLAMVPEFPDFFGFDPGIAKPRSMIWPTIKDSSHIIFGFLTANPASIQPALPADWIGNGYRNVLIGSRVDTPEHLIPLLDALRLIPARHRMVLVPPGIEPEALAGKLDKIGWVVMEGEWNDPGKVATVVEICRLAKVPVAPLPEGWGQDPSGITSDAPEWSGHPFGSKLDLRKPLASGMMEPIAAIRTLCQGAEDHCPPARPVLNMGSCSGKHQTEVRTLPDPVSVVIQKTSREELNLAPPLLPDQAVAARNQPDAIPPDPVVLPRSSQPDAEAEGNFNRLDMIVRNHLREFIAVGKALLAIRSKELWREGGFTSWAAYCQDVGDISKNYANRLIVSSEIVTQLAEVVPIGTTLPASESLVRPLVRLADPKLRANAWNNAVGMSDNGRPTALMVETAVAEMKSGGEPCPKAARRGRRPGAPGLPAGVARILDQLQAMARDRQPHVKIGQALKELRRMLGGLSDPDVSVPGDSNRFREKRNRDERDGEAAV
jgi:hypothetical protein